MIDAAEMVPDQTVIRTPKNPIKPTGGMAVLRGNLAPRGAVIKRGRTPALMTQPAAPWCSTRWRISPRAATIRRST